MLTVFSNNLRRAGFMVHAAKDLEDCLAKAKSRKPNIILINYDAPAIDAFAVCKTLHEHKIVDDKENKEERSPTVVLMADKDIPSSSAEGDEDYWMPSHHIIAASSITDVVGRIKSLFRKTRPALTSSVLEFDDVHMNLSSYKVVRRGRNIHLGPTEFKILQCLMENPKRTLSREYIMNYVWQDKSSIESRTIDVHINRLRSALKIANDEPPVIETIRSAGYCLRRSQLPRFMGSTKI
jgi:two-component system phosphate regulon response regulator PhoB